VQEFSNSECAFSYRNSFFKQNPSTIVLSAEFELTSGNQGESLGMTLESLTKHFGNFRDLNCQLFLA
jgi:UDP-N-acetylenolpyruvoylglucosamine reductase